MMTIIFIGVELFQQLRFTIVYVTVHGIILNDLYSLSFTICSTIFRIYV